MKKFMFYTNDGFTQDTDGKEIENSQILGWGDGDDLNSALNDFKQKHNYLEEYNYQNISSIEMFMDNVDYNDLLERYEKSLEKSRQYNEIIISVGYIGLFTLLSFINDSINPEVKAKIAFWTLVSLGFFITWEIIKMIISSVTEIRYHLSNKQNKKKPYTILFITWIIFLSSTLVPLIIASYWLFPALYQYLTK